MTASDELFAAIRSGDLATVDRLLTERPYLAGASDAAGLSAVTMAAYSRQPAILERILAAKPELDRFEAAIVGDLGRLAELLDEPDAGPVDERSADGFTALHLAAFFGRRSICPAAPRPGADPNLWASGPDPGPAAPQRRAPAATTRSPGCWSSAAHNPTGPRTAASPRSTRPPRTVSPGYPTS